MTYNGFDTLKEAFDAHKAWLTTGDGKRLNLSGANLSGADLSCANLSCANLSDADLSCANLSDADLWEQYLAEVVPALLTAGGKTIEEVAAGWDCHNWTNCPMAVAFNVHDLDDIPVLYRREAELFITLFDAKAIPNPLGAA